MGRLCLVCAAPVDGDGEYHARCSRSFFGTFPPPALDLTLGALQEYAARSVLARMTVTGVQKKLSLGIEKRGRDARLTVVGLWGRFVLKPPTDEYPSLPENEDTVMRMADVAGIGVVPHALVRLASGELAFISRRVDRSRDGGKLAMEDFCQICGRMTEDKYRASVERVGKLLRRYSVFPGLDAGELFARVLFNFVCGNSDMHLKNYSLIQTPVGHRLSPAYDLLCTALAIPDDPEQSALTINGKKSNLDRGDFDALATSLDIPPPARDKAYRKLAGLRASLLDTVSRNRLPAALQETLRGLVASRLEAFGGAGERVSRPDARSG